MSTHFITLALRRKRYTWHGILARVLGARASLREGERSVHIRLTIPGEFWNGKVIDIVVPADDVRGEPAP